MGLACPLDLGSASLDAPNLQNHLHLALAHVDVACKSDLSSVNKFSYKFRRTYVYRLRTLERARGLQYMHTAHARDLNLHPKSM